MTGIGAGFILLFLLLYNTRTCHCSYVDILWGQCYAFCLTQHESRLFGTEAEDGFVHGVTVKKCRRDKVCKWCLHACETPRAEYQDLASCNTHCQKTRPLNNQMGRHACEDSCSFINRSLSVKFGSCPRTCDNPGDGGGGCRDQETETTGIVGSGGECRDRCQRDIDCDYMLKCCTRGCRKMCLPIVEWSYLPKVPERLSFKTRRDGSTMVEWVTAVPEQSTKPVLYVLRWWCSYTNGPIAYLTTKVKLRLKGYNHPDGLHPGQTCQFMLAAVNQFGSHGFSKTQQFTKKFVRPTEPGNLEKVRSRLHDEKVDVTIQWQPPIYTDNLPISRYLVLWSDPLPKAIPEYERRHMHNKTLDGDKTSFTISGLEPGTIYFVQVKAVVTWKRRSIKGRPVSTYLETYAIPRAVELPGPDDNGGDVDANSAIYNISVSTPVFLHSELKAWVSWNVHLGMEVKKFMVYWVPDVCDGEAEHRKEENRLENEATTHKKEFLLYNLMSNCLYEIRIHGVNSLGDIDEGRREVFQTRPCLETQGAQPELCLATESPPLSPVDVSMRFKTSSSCVCQAVISWRQAGDHGGGEGHHPPHLLPQDSHNNNNGVVDPITVWNIVWGQSRPPTGMAAALSSTGGSDPLGSRSSTIFQAATIVYNSSPYQTQVPGTETQACLTYLENSKHYTVQIMGQSGDTKGDPAVFHFITPDYMPECYTDLEPFEGNSEDSTTRNSLELSSGEAQGNSGHSSKGCALSLLRRADIAQLLLLVVVTMSIILFHK